MCVRNSDRDFTEHVLLFHALDEVAITRSRRNSTQTQRYPCYRIVVRIVTVPQEGRDSPMYVNILLTSPLHRLVREMSGVEHGKNRPLLIERPDPARKMLHLTFISPAGGSSALYHHTTFEKLSGVCCSAHYNVLYLRSACQQRMQAEKGIPVFEVVWRNDSRYCSKLVSFGPGKRQVHTRSAVESDIRHAVPCQNSAMQLHSGGNEIIARRLLNGNG